MKFALIVAIWLVAAIVIGASGALEGLRPPEPQIIIAGLTLALLIAWRMSEAFKRFLQVLDLRLLVALHLTRFVGFYFLVLCRRNELPCNFAAPAGWGDVLVATLAAVLLISWNVTAGNRVWIGAWNTLGLIDILFVVANAASHAMRNPSSMVAFLYLPLSLLPTFLVPLIIATHIFIFSRLRKQRGAGS